MAFELNELEAFSDPIDFTKQCARAVKTVLTVACRVALANLVI